MHTFEVAFIINGIKHCVPVQADYYYIDHAMLMFRCIKDEEGEDKCTFKDWLYVVRLDGERKYLPPQITEEFKKARILSVKKPQAKA